MRCRFSLRDDEDLIMLVMHVVTTIQQTSELAKNWQEYEHGNSEENKSLSQMKLRLGTLHREHNMLMLEAGAYNAREVYKINELKRMRLVYPKMYWKTNY